MSNRRYGRAAALQLECLYPILGALVICACGSGDGVEDNANEIGSVGLRSGLPDPATEIIPDEDEGGPYAEPVLICVRDEAREAVTEEERAFGEAYYPLAVDAEIAEFPELRAALGFDHLENCEQARAWTAVRGVIVDGQPPPGMQDPGEADEVLDKIFVGVWHMNNAVFGLIRFGADGVGGCSSAVIGPRLIITAAHCVAANTTLCSDGLGNSYACNRGELFELRRANSLNGTYQSYGTRSVTTFKNDNYGGVGDPGDDIALIYLEDLTLPTSYAYGIDVRTPLGWFTLGGGWGRTSTNAGNDAMIGLRKAPGDNVFDVDWWPPSFTYIRDTGDGDVHLCKGDSGGPVVSFYGVAGLFSQFQGTNCRVNSGDYEDWVSPRAKMGWLEARIRAVGQCPLASPGCCSRVNSNQQAVCF